MPLGTPLAIPNANAPAPIAPMPAIQQPKQGFYGDMPMWKVLLGTALDNIAQQTGGHGVFTQGVQMQNMQRQQQHEWDRQDGIRRQDRQWALEDREAKLNEPEYFMSGRDRVRFDPATGESKVVYDGPTDFEEYATLLGLEPGSDEYGEAMRDYVLRSNGPSAQQGRVDLEGVRQGNRLSLEGVRQGNRAALRQMPTYANLHPRPAAGGGSGGDGGNRPPRTTGNVYAPILSKVAAGKPLTPGEQQVFSLYGRGGRGAGGKSGVGGMAGVPTVNSPAEAMKLPKGMRYRTPDGRIMVR